MMTPGDFASILEGMEGLSTEDYIAWKLPEEEDPDEFPFPLTLKQKKGAAAAAAAASAANAGAMSGPSSPGLNASTHTNGN